MTVFDIKEHALEALGQIEQQQEQLISDPAATTGQKMNLSPFEVRSTSRTNMDMTNYSNMLNASNFGVANVQLAARNDINKQQEFDKTTMRHMPMKFAREAITSKPRDKTPELQPKGSKSARLNMQSTMGM